MALQNNDPAQLISILASLDVNKVAAANIKVDADHLSSILDGLSVTGNPNNSRSLGKKSQHHELILEYPAVDLIPHDRGAVLQLFPPQDVHFREYPHLHDFHLETDNMYFTTRLQTPYPVRLSIPPALRQCNDLREQIKRLETAPGISTLSIVTYMLNDEMTYRTNFKTNWVTMQGYSATEVQTFECQKVVWDLLFGLNSEEPWARTIQQLVSRGCDRSYLIVREKMMSFNKNDIARDEAHLKPFWLSHANNTANQILCGRLTQTVQSFDQQHEICRLPCGHDMYLSRFYLMNNMSEEDCKTFSCFHCNARVLEERHIRRIALINDIPKRHTYLQKEKEWETMLAQANTKRHMKVNNDTLKSILDSVLTMLKVPESVMPAELCPTNAPETQTLHWHFLNEVFKQDAFFRYVSIDDLCDILKKCAAELLKAVIGVDEDEDLKKCVPSGYNRFLDRWFKRTALLIAASLEEEYKKDLAGAMSTFGGVQM